MTGTFLSMYRSRAGTSIGWRMAPAMASKGREKGKKRRTGMGYSMQMDLSMRRAGGRHNQEQERQLPPLMDWSEEDSCLAKGNNARDSVELSPGTGTLLLRMSSRGPRLNMTDPHTENAVLGGAAGPSACKRLGGGTVKLPARARAGPGRWRLVTALLDQEH